MVGLDGAHNMDTDFNAVRQEAMEFAGIGLYRYTFDGTLLFMDWGALRIFELEDLVGDPAAVAGKKLTDILVYTGPEGLMRRAIREQGRIRGREWALRTRSGKDKWVVEDAYLVHDSQSGNEAIQVLVRDVTGQKRAGQELRRRDAILEALSEAAGSFLVSPSWEESIGEVIERLGHAAQVSRLYVFEVHASQTGDLVASQRYEWSAPGIQSTKSEPRLQELPYREAGFGDWEARLRRGETIFAHRREFSPSQQEVIGDALSLLEVPIMVGGELWGMIGFDECQREREWSRVEVDALRAVADTFGAAIQRERTRKTLAETARAAERMRETMARMNACRTFDEMLEPFLDTALDVCHMDGGGVYLIQDGEARLRRHTGLPEGFIREAGSVPLASLFLQQLLSANGPVALEDRAPDYGNLHRHGLHHIYAVPLRAGNAVFGFLNLASNRDEPPSSTNLQNLHTLAIEMESLFTRVRAEEALRQSEEKYRSILDNIQEGYYETDLEGNLIFLNDALSRIFGYTLEELQGMNYRQYYPDKKAVDHAYKTFHNVYETGKAVRLSDWEVVRKDGSHAALEVSISLIHDADGHTVGFRGIARDVTERNTAEMALSEAEARYRELFENANDIVYTHDLAGRFTSLNKAGERVSGYRREEILRRNALDVLAPEERDRVRSMVQRKLTGDQPTRYESSIVAKDGRIIPLEISTRLIFKDGVPIGVQGIARDITERKEAEEERKRLEAQIRHTQKLEGLGVMAGGIAHDFNNLLVGILGNAGLALTRLSEESSARPYIRRIEETAQRAAELTNQMLAYSGKGAFVVRPIDLSQLAEEMGALLKASISKKAVLAFDCAADLPAVEADIAQIQQVLINLITNASDAIGDEEGVITVRTYVMDADRAYLSRTYFTAGIAAGRYVVLDVSDTGCGMDTETLSRIFDPFYSTKFAGRGLGLAAVLGIIRGHNGAISVHSEPGRGTTFRVLLPVLRGTQPVLKKEDARGDRTAAENWRGHGAVLVVDDEENVREVAKETIEEHGFTVLTAANGREAVEMVRRQAAQISAVLLDLTMPVMSGRDALGQIAAIAPEMPVILTSGYTEQDAASRFTGNGPAAFIQKPYLPHDLIHVLRSVLER